MPPFHMPAEANLIVGGWLIVVAVVIALAFARRGDQ